ncbi:transcriptional regulator BetI [Novosphingobium resinovorum]|uniref:Transcriptional regulator BetI n=1 Tax=Novosphingobium resinovorum TaxID=158500 RepID=A0A031K172_9SPHN|nr:TetR/AcrR family transcriptional regulator [Novosphingobium resinovorum]EZP82944.1 transcriptional regulator BetI [Novosphingobium resinovorum]
MSVQALQEAAPSGQDGYPLKSLLVGKAVEGVARQGIRNMPMRAIAANAGVTTAAIVHHFGDKSGLLRAALQQALLEDSAFHESLIANIAGRPLGYLNFVEWTANYIRLRHGSDNARFWSEVLFHPQAVAGNLRHVEAWHDMRVRAWGDILEGQGRDRSFAEALVTYLCMEEVWAQGLDSFAEYPILQRETLRALLAAMFDLSWDEEHSISALLEPRLESFAMRAPPNPDDLRERLLTEAARDLFEHGIEKVNQRRIAGNLGVSPSIIAYHFGGMSNFRNQAMWRAMIHKVADPLNPYSAKDKPLTLEDWAEGMANAISPADGSGDNGFYVSFARTIGEVALLSGREPELLPLVEHLRILDGTASYQAGRGIWAGLVSLRRQQASAFAMWMKGRAVLNTAFGYDRASTRKALIEAVTRLIRPAG